MTALSADQTARRDRMGLLAKADAAQLSHLWEGLGIDPDFQDLRAPEIGAAMVRGRAGAVGAAFNLGEITVTRCSVQLAQGAVGHAYIQGRDTAKARQAALIDALMQTDAAEQIEDAILTPLRETLRAAQTTRAAKAAATKVEFFTMVRGED